MMIWLDWWKIAAPFVLNFVANLLFIPIFSGINRRIGTLPSGLRVLNHGGNLPQIR